IQLDRTKKQLMQERLSCDFLKRQLHEPVRVRQRVDSLLLETGFLCILVAPLGLLPGGRVREHDRVTFWLLRWLLFRLMFASGVVKLTSRCPTWWGLTVWWQKLSVVGTLFIEIPVSFLFFSPLRRLRITAFYLQVLLQVLIILSGNYNFFNLLTLALCLSLLDDQHVHFWLRKPQSADSSQLSKSRLWSWLCYLVELAVWASLLFGAIVCFDLQLDWAKKSVSSRTAFTFHQFNQFLKSVTIPSIWLGVLSLTWEMVPFTYVEYDSGAKLWPGARRAYEAVDRFQLVNSYGLFRRMTGVGGRPEVEIDFMYKPGSMGQAPPLVTPHQPRLDWQMWFAALGPHTQAPWFSSLMYRLLQGKSDGHCQ
ncbi:hypothetical protein CRUP_008239, partial [Coryphaenoides rupestris]